jgi:hypothetical protein
MNLSFYICGMKIENITLNPIQKEISTNFTLNTEKYEQSFLH